MRTGFFTAGANCVEAQRLADGWVVVFDHHADYPLVLILWQSSEDGAVIDLQQTHTHTHNTSCANRNKRRLESSNTARLQV